MDVIDNLVAVKNISSENVSKFFSNVSSDNTFVNPFNDSLTRILFIICYAAVFAMCVIGKQVCKPVVRNYLNFKSKPCVHKLNYFERPLPLQ